MQKIVPLLWFSENIEEAVDFYVSLFADSKIVNVRRYGEAGPLPEGTVMMMEFELAGQEYMALNGGATPGGAAKTPHPGSISLFVTCASQVELDALWDQLAEGGEILQCGWLRDRYGFAWNIAPEGLSEVIGGDDERAERAMSAMLRMQKLDIHELRRVYAQG